jgi:CRISPR/Cas system-associated exonuclease Cas4 (RecB family)
MGLKAWSYSRLSKFESCKHHAKLAYVDKIPEPPRPLPPGKTEHANDRGTRIHDGGELFVKGGVELLPELTSFEEEFLRLRDLYKQGLVSTETEWGFDKDWGPVAWMSHDCWVRIKPDAFVMLEPIFAVVIDYKTGKRYGNEVKHAEQMQLYVIAMFLRHPNLERVTVELWYTDLDELVPMQFTREAAMRLLAKWTKRGVAITTEEDFDPKPSTSNCKFCPYKPAEFGGTGHCSVGIR